MRYSPTADEGQSPDLDPGSLAAGFCHRGRTVIFGLRRAPCPGRKGRMLGSQSVGLKTQYLRDESSFQLFTWAVVAPISSDCAGCPICHREHRGTLTFIMEHSLGGSHSRGWNSSWILATHRNLNVFVPTYI